jgi:hypothetical protein
MTSIAEWTGVTPQRFHEEILPAAQPAVIRGLVSDWPVVRAGRESARDSGRALGDYIKRFDRGQALPTMMGPPGIEGRFFYNADLSGFNFQTSNIRIGAAMDYLAEHVADERPPAFAIQSAPVRSSLPGFEAENPLALLGPAVEPRVWIGNQVIVAAHHDQSENVACVAAGRRRFTLFPPDQVANLYTGPFELTPAGAIISMVSFDDPDLERYPRFAEALKTAQVAELEPGDAIYIPYLWWHHVRSLDRINMLVNYWWAPPLNGRGEPRDAFLHAMVAIKALSPPHREAWRALFDHFVFQDDGAPGAHLPAEKLGVLGELDPQMLRALRAGLIQALSRG